LAVCEGMRLASGTLWPIPVVLDLPEQVVRESCRSGVLVLRDEQDRELGLLALTEVWRPDRLAEARTVLGTTDITHPGVRYLLRDTHPWYVTGQLSVRRLPSHPGLHAASRTPAEVKREFARLGWTSVVAFNTRNPMHAAHRAVVLRAAEALDACILIHPVVGPTQPGDVPVPVRARCYAAMMKTLPAHRAMLSLLPLAMRMGGPREAVWHALIRRNYGATAFVVGRDHASPGSDSAGRPFYGRYDAQRLAKSLEDELGIAIAAVPELFYVEGLGYLPREEVPSGSVAEKVSGTRVRQLLADGAGVPAWLVQREIVSELARAHGSAGVAGEEKLSWKP